MMPQQHCCILFSTASDFLPSNRRSTTIRTSGPAASLLLSLIGGMAVIKPGGGLMPIFAIKFIARILLYDIYKKQALKVWKFFIKTFASTLSPLFRHLNTPFTSSPANMGLNHPLHHSQPSICGFFTRFP